MTGSLGRRARILELLAGGDLSELGSARLCQVCAEVTEMTGAAITLVSGELPSGTVCVSDQVGDRLEQLQLTLGEGPGLDAYHQDRPVLEPHLAAPEVVRWPAFADAALECGARAVFGFPLQVGAVRLGALDLYRDQPGPMTDDQHADALAMADIAAQAILVLQAGAPPGSLSDELEAGSDFQHVVHQAAGMVAVQLDVSVGQALVRLRAYAFANERNLDEVAADVVARTLRFDDRDFIPEP